MTWVLRELIPLSLGFAAVSPNSYRARHLASLFQVRIGLSSEWEEDPGPLLLAVPLEEIPDTAPCASPSSHPSFLREQLSGPRNREVEHSTSFPLMSAPPGSV